MALYLKPPRGTIDYHILQKCVDERIRFIKSMTSSSVSVHNIEYLYEDSAFDRAGHFTLRLAAVKHSNFAPFFINSEVKLLKLRLNSYKIDSIRIFLKNQLRHAKECILEDNKAKLVTFLNVLSCVLTRMLTRSYRNHVFNEEHVNNDKCKIFTINVPFQYCSSLISKHDFNLKNGYVQIPCQKWKDLFVSFFYTYLRAAINEMHHSQNVQIALEDERIKSIIASVCIQESSNSSSEKALSLTKAESKFFPPCMQHLQEVLQKNHRLAHEERFNLSLFLKDIGLSVNDSISYWKGEYSMESKCSKCSHNWQQDERKYIYSIRHLYGLEGSRKSYKTRSCNNFQNMNVSPIQEGGCPFKHFDDDKLKSLLSKHFSGNENDINNILLERIQNPLSACNSFLKILCSCEENSTHKIKGDSHSDITCDSEASFSSSSSSGCDISFNNPVQYFSLAKTGFNK